MPDLQTEMQKILHAWEQPETTTETTTETTMPKPTKFTSQAVFDAVQTNPGGTMTDYVNQLSAKGHKVGSVSSLLYQMVKAGSLARNESGGFITKTKTYQPVRKVLVAKGRKNKVKAVPVPANLARFAAEFKNKDRVQEIMDTISLPDAKRLHNALNEYFGAV